MFSHLSIQVHFIILVSMLPASSRCALARTAPSYKLSTAVCPYQLSSLPLLSIYLCHSAQASAGCHSITNKRSQRQATCLLDATKLIAHLADESGIEARREQLDVADRDFAAFSGQPRTRPPRSVKRVNYKEAGGDDGDGLDTSDGYSERSVMPLVLSEDEDVDDQDEAMYNLEASMSLLEVKERSTYGEGTVHADQGDHLAYPSEIDIHSANYRDQVLFGSIR